ncbi:sporulation lipoprotein, YhcN/YlaJ family [Schinkia azotoformans MEV2011]|uniref:Sporulation lipoprotein, YhcN/YlaJ family n=1 Tax=Schinkia azotoformans MEV2011 TaxID=1348973 RepID=A0A072NEM5_SCHAZ|nr:YhcN/YlaJ family sporulation lipoprotein [Schinkia azotoformans]KEF36011.1 sporulation lipoprotein, YhcN/YlaJ family [Schinkia azotoformans MEV2011]MEC1697979.1 YhcN/YlaJ family sporulation lipoprotein [Schinkia azotoformans]MEC1727199.1 YhcN/YlaJ family sporulation lipoprotein [Schinkia azotoformans]MEC1773484.1 YhcN/YlaJ family sporulation lipoprotein [Schinkia azotoformans]MEC1782253.1 YhcN/YlaJ family sporulation lipoprotein [Schinkia azotoformans]
MRKLLLTTISFLFVAAGCAGNNDEKTALNNGQNNFITVNQPNNNVNGQLTGEQIAEHLVDLATRNPDVKDATAVVAGNYAVVGIDVDKGLERSRVGSVKYSVAETLKDDPYGAKAVVVADADTVERLREMRKDIQNGKPVSGVMNELAAIVGRLMPQIPYDINTDKGPNEGNNKQLKKGEKKQLDQIQKEQSKAK